MPISLLCQILVFVGLLPFHVATLPSPDSNNLPRAAVASVPALEIGHNITLPPFPATTTLRNTSNDLFPSNYVIPYTNPLVILKIHSARGSPIDSSYLNYVVVRGLDSLVQTVIRSHGDNELPPEGVSFSWANVSIAVKSHLPGTIDLTYGLTAKLLRGVWELAVLYGAYELDMDVYIGSLDEAHYRGHIGVYLTAAATKTA